VNTYGNGKGPKQQCNEGKARRDTLKAVVELDNNYLEPWVHWNGNEREVSVAPKPQNLEPGLTEIALSD